MALIVNINIASKAPLTVSPERDDGLISPLNGCNGVAVEGDGVRICSCSWAAAGARRRLGAR